MQSILIHPSQVTTLYPCLKISKATERVVLFTGPETGVEVHCGKAKNGSVGSTGTTWEEDGFEFFHGEVTLSN